MEANILGNRIKTLRLEANLTQEEFGKPYSLKKSTVSQYESGSSRPDDELKKRIALDYNVSLDWLMGLSDIRNYTEDPNITIALHSDTDYDDLPKEALEEINNFVEYIKQKYKDNK
ncbi:MAG: helix-turn-helix domain-containing protein [Clostridium beijerinckii]|jgi:transcriptional regulator with XRE-family HTH domain|nr:helix-turn-helix domain-containing protein [Clostridium beijerinckii]MCI1578610.1 helix-turn-helix domain-containing protein [Clostridium beijerinckii]MCI1582058.1 helix-turn-helix domain-containing protein [Clostridium beijerinckii]MCI1621908.1 helix-turn-helix domain-containing protein [Clostridium beijerinckii]